MFSLLSHCFVPDVNCVFDDLCRSSFHLFFDNFVVLVVADAQLVSAAAATNTTKLSKKRWKDERQRRMSSSDTKR